MDRGTAGNVFGEVITQVRSYSFQYYYTTGVKLCRFSTTDTGKLKPCTDCNSLKPLKKLLNTKITASDKSRERIDWKVSCKWVRKSSLQ
jgi:hypothetical protein